MVVMYEELMKQLQKMYEENKLESLEDYDEDDIWCELLNEKKENDLQIGGKYVKFNVYKKGSHLCIQL